MRVPMLDRGVRDSTAIPTMTCAQCSKEVHIRLIGEHQCQEQSGDSDMSAGMRTRVLSSFFDAPEYGSRATGPVSRYNNPHEFAEARKGIESRVFPATYKPSLQLLSEDAATAGTDGFDFDEMLNNASAFRPGAMSSDSLSDEVISPGPRKVPIFNNSSSSLSLDGFESGLSPYEESASLSPSGRRDAVPGEQLSTRTNGSEFSFKSDMRLKNNTATSQNSLMQYMAASSAAVSPSTKTTAAAAPESAHPPASQRLDSELVPPFSASSSSVFTISSMSSPVAPTSMTRTNSSTVLGSGSSLPSQQPLHRGGSSTSVGEAGISSAMLKLDSISHNYQDRQQQQQKQQQQRQQMQKQGEEEEQRRKQQEQTTPAQHIMGRDNGAFTHRKTSSNARGPAAAAAATTPAPGSTNTITAAAANKAEGSRGHDNNNNNNSIGISISNGGSSSSLSIGSMMKAQAAKPRRGEAAGNNGSIVRRQGSSSPASPTYPPSSGGSSSSVGEDSRASQTRRQQHQTAQSPTSADSQICISAKRPPLGSANSSQDSPTFSSPLHDAPSKSNAFSSSTTTTSHSLTSASTFSSSAQRATEENKKKLTRNATAPALMNHSASSATAMRSASSGGSSRAAAQPTNPLDVLASLLPPSSGGATRTAAGAGPPHINTQVSGRSGGQHHHARAPSGPRSAGVGGGKANKTAKLDSLLDDLMGEMQALSFEVRSESDRDSMVSTASVGNSASSPHDVANGAAREHPLRGRFDSTVSTASTSSTLSAGGAHKQRQLHCATCGVGIATGKGAVLRSSGLRANDAVPSSVQGIEHQNKIYCVRDYKRQVSTTATATPATRCQGCGRQCEPSSRDTVNALDAWWHRSCFNCQECHTAFPDKSFYVFENRPYCRYDYHKLNKSLCMACREPIEGPCAQVFEGRFHPGCFACYHCKEPLRDVYYSLDGYFLCENHVHQHKSNRSANKRMTVFGHV